ncbi:hypothetical protein [Gulosibacter massiliensis]|uniref:hypothetical protein n=1 Tax=Gulosibacter massiliensis TaxID=2479839 RepID=UPI0019D1C700|nr:hypothetical protein [Gulosibacter massiliensis]
MRAASALGVAGVFLNLIVPGQVFEIVLNLAGLGMVAVWSSIIVFLVLVIVLMVICGYRVRGRIDPTALTSTIGIADEVKVEEK